jgi:hypothetical protein
MIDRRGLVLVRIPKTADTILLTTDEVHPMVILKAEIRDGE